MPSTKSVAESIELFAFDVPEDTEPFSERLASENGWSREFAGRVIREYRRFLILAMTSGHAVVPSDEVDQAWHLSIPTRSRNSAAGLCWRWTARSRL